jgi:hypothetical protein
MFIIRAPYPGFQTTTLLPSPTFSDQKGLRASVTTARAMDGTLYTHVKTREGLHKFKWDFKLSRDKASELRECLDTYFDKLIEVTDHNDVRWTGYLKNNPFEFSGHSRAEGFPGNELYVVTLEFEEK